jgi:hypothetical protein
MWKSVVTEGTDTPSRNGSHFMTPTYHYGVHKSPFPDSTLSLYFFNNQWHNVTKISWPTTEFKGISGCMLL